MEDVPDRMRSLGGEGAMMRMTVAEGLSVVAAIDCRRLSLALGVCPPPRLQLVTG